MPAAKSGGDSRNTLYCSFCGKSQHEVRKLIAGPTVFICDECVELCMPIGGLKEKLLAALRGGLKTVLIPKENERDLPEIPDNVKKGLEIVPVSTVDEVLARALVKPLVAIEWPNDLEVAAAKPAESPEVRAH